MSSYLGGHRNVPDDWDSYWYRCSRCGTRYHASEGGCYCTEERDEDEDIFEPYVPEPAADIVDDRA